MAKRRRKAKTETAVETSPPVGIGRIGNDLDHRRFAIFASILLLVLTWVIYANSVKGEFTNWDDTILVVNNPDIKSLAPGDVARIFTPVAGKTYQPVRVLSYAIDYRLWELNSVGYHIVNTLFHSLAGILLFFCLCAVLARLRPDKEMDNRLIALLAAVLWVCHPINVESVAWIASRKYVLLASFSFGSLWCYVRTSQAGKLHPGFATGATLCFVLAVMSSPFAVILPPIFLLFDYCREKELNPICGLRKHGLAIIPIVIAAAVMYAMVAKGLFGGGGGPSLRDAHVAGKPHWTVMTMTRVLFDYAMNFSWPMWLNCKYPNKMEQSLANPKIIIGLLAVLALAASVIWQLLKGNKVPLFCAGWMLICWGPVSNIVPISTTMADRYMYLPSVGVFLGLVLAVNALVEREKLPGRAAVAVFAVLAVVFSGFTMHRNLAWRSSMDLWTASIARHPENPVAQNNMGNALRDHGNKLREEGEKTKDQALVDRGKAMVEEARPHFERSLAIFEPHAEAHQSLGSHHLKKDEFVPAEKHLTRALELNPNYSEALNNLAILYAKTAVFEKAIDMFDRSIQLNPNRPGVWRNLAKASVQAQQFERGADAYMQASQLDQYVGGYIEAGVLYGGKLGDHEKAVNAFKLALGLQPGNIKARRNLGVSLANLDQYDEAEEAFVAVLKALPDDPSAQRFLNLVRQRQDK